VSSRSFSCREVALSRVQQPVWLWTNPGTNYPMRHFLPWSRRFSFLSPLSDHAVNKELRLGAWKLASILLRGKPP
jgi:hypothetical protein